MTSPVLPTKPFALKDGKRAAIERLIRAIEIKYKVRYVGFYGISWTNNEGYRIFYQDQPNEEAGHSHYMGVIDHGDGTYSVFNAKEIETARFPAYRLGDATIVTRYNHDFRTLGQNIFLDGGLGPVRYNPQHPPNGWVQIIEGREVFCRYLIAR